jgi:hypothetical protein
VIGPRCLPAAMTARPTKWMSSGDREAREGADDEGRDRLGTPRERDQEHEGGADDELDEGRGEDVHLDERRTVHALEDADQDPRDRGPRHPAHPGDASVTEGAPALFVVDPPR